QVPQRTALVTERDAAVHAPASLLGDDRQQRRPDPRARIDLVPILQPLSDRTSPGNRTLRRQETAWISHPTPPVRQFAHSSLRCLHPPGRRYDPRSLRGRLRSAPPATTLTRHFAASMTAASTSRPSRSAAALAASTRLKSFGMIVVNRARAIAQSVSSS